MCARMDSWKSRITRATLAGGHRSSGRGQGALLLAVMQLWRVGHTEVHGECVKLSLMHEPTKLLSSLTDRGE